MSLELPIPFYTQTLAVPTSTTHRSELAMKGEGQFERMGCQGCHTPELRTGAHEIAAVANQTIRPYTDLLLHNMGFELADSRPDYEASGTEWRTPPLWGIGLTPAVLGTQAYLHDGRARTLEEAVLWHGGEAEAAAGAFRTARATDRAALIAFLRSL